MKRATVTLPDGRRLRGVRVVWSAAGEPVTVTGRDGTVAFTSTVYQTGRDRGTFTLDTDAGPVTARKGCGCGR